MARFKQVRCETCGLHTIFHCYYCNAPTCKKHRIVDENNRLICMRCDVKFYMMWQQEKDELHATELRYLEWLKERVSAEADTD
jgi:hypothetical protein